MKLHPLMIILLGTLVLAGCNFSLAADITPPPDYVSPTPPPTLGALYPATAPDIKNGAAIFTQNCAACHGDKGLGDGPQSMQLPLSVPAIGLPEIARPASPAQWFSIVSQGNLDRFMPPFIGALSDQERWDVVGYVMTLHTTPDEIAQGKSLLEANCPGCANKFPDEQKMAALSEADLYALIKNGSSEIPAFGTNFSDSQTYAVAAYIRTLTFAPLVQFASSSPTQPVAVASTPVGSGTPSSGTISPVAQGFGSVSGSVQLMGGGVPPTSLTITLHGYDHDPTQSTTPQEILTLTAMTAPDGTFKFDQVAMPINRIFLADASYGGIKYQSAFGTVSTAVTTLTLTPIKLYESSTEFNTLIFNQVHFYTDFSTAGTVQVLEIYTFTNSTNKAVIISTDGTTIPFIKLPSGAQNAGYQADQSQSQFVAADQGIAAIPSDKPYSIIAFFNLPYDNQVQINQPFVVDAPSVVLLIPDGMSVGGPQLTNLGVQAIQNVNYQELQATNFKAGDVLTLTISGTPPQAVSTAPTPAINNNPGLLIGAGVLGVLLIAVGGFLFLRNRRRNEEEGEQEFDSSDEVLDAMLALDDLQHGGKISMEVYSKRRGELKGILKKLS